MTTLFRPTRPFMLPEGAVVVLHKGKSHVRIGGSLYPLSKDGTKFLKPAAKWAAEVVFADGRRKRVRFSPNKAAAQVMLADLLKKIEDEKAGLRSPVTDHRRMPLTALLTQYERHLLDKQSTAKEARQTARRCELLFTGCGFVQLADLDATAAERWLAERRVLPKSEGGFGPSTSNHYAKSVKAFGNWLVKTDRELTNPFRHLAKVNATVGILKNRRPLSAEEFTLLLSATRTGQERYGLSGPQREALYTVAAYTGLRASELASLTPASFALDADPPTVTVEAAYSKHRRKDQVPLHPELVVYLRSWVAGVPLEDRLWPGKWALHTAGFKLIRHDLAVARSVWIEQAGNTGERAERQKSDFLAYRDREGRTADFHAMRHRFITSLVKAGVQPHDAKELARHSTIVLTLDKYTHVGLQDAAAAVVKLPGFGGAGAAPGAANFDNGRGGVRTGEETRTPGSRTAGSPQGLNSQAIEENRGEVRAGEGSTPDRSRTCNLRLRRPTLYPVELRVRVLPHRS
jgi:integrase/recombinase XerD